MRKESSVVTIQSGPRVLLSGHFFEPTGYGTAARAYVHAFAQAGIGLLLQNRTPSLLRPVNDTFVGEILNQTVEPEFFISHAEPCDLLAGERPLNEVIALTTFETETLPEDCVRSLNRVREVWVPSAFNAEAFRRQLNVPVFRLPHAINVASGEQTDQEEIHQCCGLEASDFVFLTTATWQERKNLAGTIEAFLRAFPDDPGVKLVLKTTFYFVNLPAALAQIRRRIEQLNLPGGGAQAFERVRIVDLEWRPAQMEALLQRANCYVSLHRGEGWCYPLFDAACAGMPVVATGYSGPMDYLTPESHHLVNYALVPIDRGDDPPSFPFTPQLQWAQPDTLHAAEQMRAVYENYGQACQRAEAAGTRLRQEYSFEAVGRMARERLKALREG
jgi:glycosyltransferase involved in cell wall biosynthesis